MSDARVSAKFNELLASGEWRQHTDPSSGKLYYSQRDTKKVTWDLKKHIAENVLKLPNPSTTTSDNELVHSTVLREPKKVDNRPGSQRNSPLKTSDTVTLNVPITNHRALTPLRRVEAGSGVGDRQQPPAPSVKIKRINEEPKQQPSVGVPDENKKKTQPPAVEEKPQGAWWEEEAGFRREVLKVLFANRKRAQWAHHDKSIATLLAGMVEITVSDAELVRALDFGSSSTWSKWKYPNGRLDEPQQLQAIALLPDAAAPQRVVIIISRTMIAVYAKDDRRLLHCVAKSPDVARHQHKDCCVVTTTGDASAIPLLQLRIHKDSHVLSIVAHGVTVCVFRVLGIGSHIPQLPFHPDSLNTSNDDEHSAATSVQGLYLSLSSRAGVLHDALVKHLNAECGGGEMRSGKEAVRSSTSHYEREVKKDDVVLQEDASVRERASSTHTKRASTPRATSGRPSSTSLGLNRWQKHADQDVLQRVYRLAKREQERAEMVSPAKKTPVRRRKDCSPSSSPPRLDRHQPVKGTPQDEAADIARTVSQQLQREKVQRQRMQTTNAQLVKLRTMEDMWERTRSPPRHHEKDELDDYTGKEESIMSAEAIDAEYERNQELIRKLLILKEKASTLQHRGVV